MRIIKGYVAVTGSLRLLPPAIIPSYIKKNSSPCLLSVDNSLSQPTRHTLLGGRHAQRHEQPQLTITQEKLPREADSLELRETAGTVDSWYLYRNRTYGDYLMLCNRLPLRSHHIFTITNTVKSDVINYDDMMIMITIVIT